MTDSQCELHGGTIRDQFGNHVCCIQEEWAVFPQTPPPREPTPPPAGLREQVAAALHQEDV